MLGYSWTAIVKQKRVDGIVGSSRPWPWATENSGLIGLSRRVPRWLVLLRWPRDPHPPFGHPLPAGEANKALLLLKIWREAKVVALSLRERDGVRVLNFGNKTCMNVRAGEVQRFTTPPSPGPRHFRLRRRSVGV